MRELSYFSTDYYAARTLFRKLAINRGWELHRLTINEAEDLSIDIALWHGSDSYLVVHSSGLHGVEAFPGSAVQCAFLDDWGPSSSNLPSYALIHCVNPFGMRYLRRWNSQNIDLNRNFLSDFSAPLDNPLYERLSSFLNPVSSNQLPYFELSALRLLTKYRFSSMQQAIAQGQYGKPEGLFFGGKQRTKEANLLLSFLQQHLSGYRTIRGIDFHTGLGKFGQSSFYLENASEPNLQRAASWLNQPLILAQSGKRQSYQTQGSLVSQLQRLYRSKDCSVVTQEIGTVGPINILRVLRKENYYYHFEPKRREAVARRLKQAFCPEDSRWKAKAAESGLRALKQASVDYNGE